MHIFVGSTNPVKINAVIQAASETWPDVKVEGIEVESGIADQPRSDEETKQGSMNRARNVLAKASEMAKERNQQDDTHDLTLGVGLEGGVFENDQGEMWSTVWVSVADQQGNVFSSNGARFLVPSVVANRIRQGEEMGPIIAEVVGEYDVRSKQGMIGVITQNFVDRTEEYMSIAKMALGLWYGRNWYDKLHD